MLSSFSITFALLGQSGAKLAVGWVVVLIGISLGMLALCFPAKRKSPTGEDDEVEDPKKKKKK
jgi:hypothetical protein